MATSTILFYTSGKKPFVQRFFDEHCEQAIRLKFNFICITANYWSPDNPAILLQNKQESTQQFAGILEAILQGIEGLPNDSIVFLAEDDCLYHESRFSQEFISLASHEPDRIFYQTNVSFISPLGFYTPKIQGMCLHSAFGTVASIRHNISHKLPELNGESGYPFSSVEPVSYPTSEKPDIANAMYRTRNVESTIPLSLDFRGYGEQTWQPDGTEPTWQNEDIWGNAGLLWKYMINPD